MPPKSGAGRPRRATRITSRKSTPVTPSPHETTPIHSSDVEENTASITPNTETSAAHSADVVLDTQQVLAVAAESTTESIGVESGLSETLTAMNPTNLSEADQGFVSPNPEPMDSAAEFSVKENEDGIVKNLINDNNSRGKTKKLVKKTVKVVKKVIKKVPKRMVKSEGDSKVDELGKAENAEKADATDVSLSVKVDENTEDVSVAHNEKSVLMEVEKSEGAQEKKIMNVVKNVPERVVNSEVGRAGMTTDVAKNAESLVSVTLKAENLDADVSLPMKVDEKTETYGNNGVSIARNDKCEDVLRGSMDKDAKAKVSTETVNEEVGQRNDQCGNGNEDLGDGKVEVEVDVRSEAEEVGDKGAKREDGVGEVKLFSGVLEAMQRRKRRKTEIFIGGLDRETKEEDIKNIFQEAGEILDVTIIMKDKVDKSKAYAFLRYASPADARKAVEKFTKVEICGKQCSASLAKGNDTIYLGNIDKYWKDKDVVKLLHEIGIEKIDKVNVMADPNNTECNRGFAFLELETCKDAQIAYKKLQKKEVFGINQKIKVAWAEPLMEPDEEEMLKVKTVYAEFIPSTWDEEKVKDIFKGVGEIDYVVLARSLKSSRRKDFAFISYKTREAAISCIESFSQESPIDDGVKVNVKVSLAKPQNSRKLKQTATPISKEVPKEKPKAVLGNARQTDLKNKGKWIGPHQDNQVSERSSTTAELVHLLREQALWRHSTTSRSNGLMDIDNPDALSGRKRQFSVMEAGPLYTDMNVYPRSRLEGSHPVASSRGSTTDSAYYQQPDGYSPGPRYGDRSCPSNIERIWERAHGSNVLHRRY